MKKIKMFDVVVFIIALFLVAIVLYPLILIISYSISDPGLVATGQILLLPKGINFEGYKAVFEDSQIMLGYANTIFYTDSDMHFTVMTRRATPHGKIILSITLIYMVRED